MRAILTIVILVLLLSPLEDKRAEAIPITGNITLTFSDLDLRGNLEKLFSKERGFSPEKVPDWEAKLSLTAQVFPGLVLTTSIKLREEVISDLYVTAQGSSVRLTAGDFLAGFYSGEFALYTRKLEGIKGSATLGRWTLTTLEAQTKGILRVDIIEGDGTIGPYKLSRKPVIENSESVEVDGVPYRRNRNYTIDYGEGLIEFKEIIPTTSTIEVVYEYLPGEDIKPREVYGIRSDYQLDDFSTIALIYIREKGEGNPSEDDEQLPFEHYVYGVEGSLLLKPGITAYGEIAHSGYHSEEDLGGNALKLGLDIQLVGFTLSANLRRVDPDFKSLNNLRLKSDSQEMQLTLSRTFSPELYASATYSHSRDDLRDDPDENITFYSTLSGELSFSPPRSPHLLFSISKTKVIGEKPSPSPDNTTLRTVMELRKSFGSRLEVVGSRETEIFSDKNNPLLSYQTAINSLSFKIIPVKKLTLSPSLSWESSVGIDDHRGTTQTLGVRYQPSKDIGLSGKYKLYKWESESFEERDETEASLITLNARPFEKTSLSINYRAEEIRDQDQVIRSFKTTDLKLRYKPQRRLVVEVLYSSSWQKTLLSTANTDIIVLEGTYKPDLHLSLSTELTRKTVRDKENNYSFTDSLSGEISYLLLENLRLRSEFDLSQESGLSVTNRTSLSLSLRYKAADWLLVALENESVDFRDKLESENDYYGRKTSLELSARF